MPDSLEYFNQPGIGTIQAPLNTYDVPTIDFDKLHFEGPQLDPDSGNESARLMNQFNESMFKAPSNIRSTAPLPVSSESIKKTFNSGAFHDLGYNRWANEELRYDPAVSNWESIVNSSKQFAVTTLGAFTSFFRQNLDTFKAITDKNQSQWLNEANLNKLKQDEEYRNMFPVFSDPEKQHWYSYIPFMPGSGDLYESFIPNLGFTVGTILGVVGENILIDALTGGTGTLAEGANSLRKVYKAIGEFNTLRKGAQGAKALAGFAAIRGADIGLHGWLMYNTAASEAAMESGMNYNETKQELIDDYTRKNGRVPTKVELDKFEKNAVASGEHTFAQNIAILLPSNAIMFRNLMMPSFARKAAMDAGMTSLSKAFRFNVGSAAERFKITIDPVVKDTFKNMWKAGGIKNKLGAITGLMDISKYKFLSEGFEESFQRFSSKYNKEQAKSKSFGVPDNSFDLAWEDAFSKEGIQEFLGGAVMGAIFQGSGHVLRRYSSNRVKDAQGNVTLKNNWLASLVGESYQMRKYNQLQHAGKIANELNLHGIDTLLKDEGFMDLVRSNASSNKMEAFLANKDMFNVDNIQQQELTNMLYSGFATGKIDLRIDQLKKLSEMNDDQIAEFMKRDKVDGLQESIKALALHIEERAPEFEQIFNIEKDRFQEQLLNVEKQNKEAVAAYNETHEKLKAKYNNNLDGLVNTVNRAIDLRNKINTATEAEYDQAKSDFETFRDANMEALVDHTDLENKMDNAIESKLRYYAVEHGRKAAVFAADQMLQAAEKSRETLKDLRKIVAGTYHFSEVGDLLLVDNLKNKISEVESSLKRMKESDKLLRFPDKDLETSLFKQRDMLESLKKAFEGDRKTLNTKKAAAKILQYLKEMSGKDNVDPDIDKSVLDHLEHLIRLQTLHQSNLNLYNFLTTSDDTQRSYQKYYVDTVQDFLNKAVESAKQKEKPEEGEQGEPIPEARVIVEEVQEAIQNEEPITPEQVVDLTIAAVTSTAAAEVLNIIDEQEDPLILEPGKFNVGDTVLYLGTEYKITSIDMIDGKEWLQLEGFLGAIEASQVENPNTIPPVQPSPNIIVDNEPYTPDELKAEEAKQNQQYDGAPIRTTTNDLKDKKNGRNEDSPELADDYGSFRSEFLDFLKTRSDLELYEFHIEVDQLSNYPEGSDQHTYIKNNPDNKAIVIVVKRKGEDKFIVENGNYKVNPDGKRIVFPINNPKLSNEIATQLGGRSFKIDVEYVSQGLMDDFGLPTTKWTRVDEFLNGSGIIPQYHISNAGIKGSKLIFENPETGKNERNGAANLRIDNGYLMKLWPVRANELKLAGQPIDIISLIDRPFASEQEAQEVAVFLSSLFFNGYTNNTHFYITRDFRVRARQVVDKIVVSNDQIKLKLMLTTQRMNFEEKSAYEAHNVFHINADGSLNKSTISYGDFILQNAITNKKFYTKNGVKVVKTINKFLKVKGTAQQLLDKAKTEETPEQNKRLLTNEEEIEVLKKLLVVGNKINYKGNQYTVTDHNKSGGRWVRLLDISGNTPSSINIINTQNNDSLNYITFLIYENDYSQTLSGQSVQNDARGKELAEQKIRKEWQEELDSESRNIFTSSELFINEDGEHFKIQNLKNGKKRVSASDENGKTLTILDEYDQQVPNEAIIAGGLTKVRDLEFTNRLKDEINAKYQAQLDALNKPVNDIEAQKADIEKRRQEELKNGEINLGDITLKHKVNNYGAIENEIVNNKTGEGVLQLITASGDVRYAPIIGNNFEESLVSFSGKNISEQSQAIFSGIKINDIIYSYTKKINAKYDAELAALNAPSAPLSIEDQIKLFFANAAKDIGESAAEKIRQIVDKILAGTETEEKAKQGLGPTFIKGIDDLLALKRQESGQNTGQDVQINDTLTQEPIQEKKDTLPEALPGAKPSKKKGPRRGLERSFTIDVSDETLLQDDELKEIEQTFPGTVRRLFNIVNSNAYANWEWGAIYLYKNSPSGSGYHEAWHHFSQMYLTLDQKKDLYNEARENPLLKDKSDFEVEEFMAEDYRNFRRGKSVLAPKRNGIFGIISRILDWLFKRNNIRTLYTKLRKGNLNGYTPSTLNVQFGKLDSGLTNEVGLPFYGADNSTKTERYNLMLKSLTGRVMHEWGAGFSLFRGSNKQVRREYLEDLAQDLRNTLNDEYVLIKGRMEEQEALNQQSSLRETIEDILKINANFNRVFDYFIKTAGIITHSKDDNTTSSPTQWVSDDLDENAEVASDDDSTVEQAKEGSMGSDKQTGFEKKGNEKSVLEDASIESRMMIEALSKVEVDKDGMPVYEEVERDGETVVRVALLRNGFGLTQPVSLSDTMTNLAILLQGSDSLEEMYGRMSLPLNQRIFPELALILERMGLVNPNPQYYYEIPKFTQFFKDFQKVNVDIYTVQKYQKDGGISQKKETKRTQDLVEKRWSENFALNYGSTTISPRIKEYISENRAERKVFLSNKKLVFDFANKQDIEDFLALIGMHFSQVTKESKDYEKTVRTRPLQRMLDYLNLKISMGDVITSPIKTLMEYIPEGTTYKDSEGKLQKLYSEKSTVKEFSALEAEYSSETPSMSFRTAEGNLIYGLMQSNWLNRTVSQLNKATSYDEIKGDARLGHLNTQNNPDVQYSLMLNTVFNIGEGDELRRTVGTTSIQPIFELGNYSGWKVIDDIKGDKGKSTTALNKREKIIMDLNSLITTGSVEVPRTESSASAYFLKLNTYANIVERGGVYSFNTDTLNELPVPLSKIEEPYENKTFRNYWRLQFLAELNTIQNVYNSDLPGYNKIQRFALFEKILSTQTKKDILARLIKDKEVIATTENAKRALSDLILKDYEAELDKAVSDYFRNKVDTFKTQVIEKLGITEDDMSGILYKGLTTDAQKRTHFNRMITSFVINSSILNLEYIKLIEGPIGFHKKFHKRAKGAISTGTIAVESPWLQEFLNNTHRNSLGYSVGSPVADVRRARTAIFNDYIRVSANVNQLVNDLRKVNPKLTIQQAKDKLGFSKNNAYYEMTVGDGQGHCTLDFYRKFRIQVANWSDADEKNYKLEVIRFRRDNNLYTTLGEDQMELDNEYYADNWDDLEEKPIAYWVPIKMQHNGNQASHKGVFAPILDKFSIAPLIPSVIKGKALEELNMKLLKEGIEYTKYESGTKKYAYTSNSLYKNNKQTIQSKPFVQYQVFTSNLKEQLTTTHKVKDEATWGTQMRKLFMANMFDKGSANTPKFQKLLDDYKSLLNEVHADAKDKLYKSLGLKEEKYTDKDGKEKTRVIVTDRENLVKELKKQAETRDLPVNVIDAIKYDESTGDFYYPIEVMSNRSAIQDMIAGLIFKKMVSLKVNGDMLIQISGAGFEQKGYDKGLSYYELEYDEKGNVVRTKPIGIKVALTPEFQKILNKVHPDGEKIGTIDRLNRLLKSPGWSEDNKELITIIGYRIPTQGPNSMEFMRIEEFLDPKAGSIIILPYEIVAKAGSDFDIDKMTIIRPAISKNGNIIKDSVDIGSVDERAAKLLAEYDKLVKSKGVLIDLDTLTDEDAYNEEDFGSLMDDIRNIEMDLNMLDEERKELERIIEDYKEVKDRKKYALTNKAIQLYDEALSSPEMFTQLVTPNNTDDIVAIVEQIKTLTGENVIDYKDTDIIGVQENLEKFVQFLSGKKALGIFALNNTLSQLFQQVGMTLNKNYGVNNTVTAQKLIDYNNNSETNLGDKIDFSSVYNYLDQSKQDIFSQFVNATVDIASNPYYVLFSFTPENIGAAVFLIHYGVSPETIVWLMKQPIVQEYNKKIEKSDASEKNLWKLRYLTGKMDDEYGNYNTKFKKINDGLKTENKTLITTNAQKLQYLAEEMDRGESVFANDQLKSFIKQYYKKGLDADSLNALAQTSDQREIFAFYLKTQEQANLLRDLQGTSQMDTKKYDSPIAATIGRQQMVNVLNSGLFDKDATIRIWNDSMISSFNVFNDIINIFQSIMPIGMDKDIINKGVEIMKDIYGDKVKKLKFQKVFLNDWIEYIIKNFAQVDGKNIQDFSNDLRLASRKSKERLLTETLRHFNLNYPELIENPFISKLFIDEKGDYRNVVLNVGMDNSTSFKNVLTEGFNALINFSADKVYRKDGSRFTDAQVKEIRDFGRKLQYYSFDQSGFNRSMFGFFDVVPYQEINDVFNDAIGHYLNFTFNNSDAKTKLVNIFEEKFKTQNKSLRLLSRKELEDSGLEMNPEPQRGKLYKIDGFDSSKITFSTPQQVTPITPTKNISIPNNKPLEDLLNYVNAKKVSKGILQIDGQHYYIESSKWNIMHKRGHDELFINPTDDDEVFIGVRESGTTNFHSEPFEWEAPNPNNYYEGSIEFQDAEGSPIYLSNIKDYQDKAIYIKDPKGQPRKVKLIGIEQNETISELTIQSPTGIISRYDAYQNEDGIEIIEAEYSEEQIAKTGLTEEEFESFSKEEQATIMYQLKKCKSNGSLYK